MGWVIGLLTILVLIAAFNARADNPVAAIVQVVAAGTLLLGVAALLVVLASAVALFVYWAFTTKDLPEWVVYIAMAIVGLVAVSVLRGVVYSIEEVARRLWNGAKARGIRER